MPPFLEEISYSTDLLLGIFVLLASLYSLHLGRKYDRQVRETVLRKKKGFHPHVCLIMPCKGEEPHLRENIAALLNLNYPNYHVVIVTDNEKDPAYAVAQNLQNEVERIPIQLITSIPTQDRSGKVSALLTALERNRGKADVYAFVDSDSTVTTSWLSELVDPLADANIGATTGFRWYLAEGFWSEVQSAWNASGSNLMFDDRYNFPWGGAMAVRAETLDRIRIGDVWKNALSDDLTLNIALRAHGFHIRFLPQCTVLSFTTNTTCSNLLRWATNQTVLMRLYHHKVWNYALGAYTLFNVGFILGVISVLVGFLISARWFIPAIFLLLPALFGLLRSRFRCTTYQWTLARMGYDIRKSCSRGRLGSLIVPWIMTYCIIKSIFTREIEWRGRRYSLRKFQIATPRSIPQTTTR